MPSPTASAGLSFKALGYVWDYPLCPRDKLVLLALADHANDEDFTCFPSMRRMARKTGYSTTTIQRAIDSLENLGLITRERRKRNNLIQMANLYTLVYAQTQRMLREG